MVEHFSMQPTITKICRSSTFRNVVCCGNANLSGRWEYRSDRGDHSDNEKKRDLTQGWGTIMRVVVMNVDHCN